MGSWPKDKAVHYPPLPRPIRVSLRLAQFEHLVAGETVEIYPGFGTSADSHVEVTLLNVSLDEMYHAIDQVWKKQQAKKG